MTFDVYQELGGEAGRRAYLEETGDPGGPPNDFVTRNESDALRTVPVDEDVEVWLLPRDQQYPMTERRASFQELPDYFASQAEVLGGPPQPDEDIASGRELVSPSHFLITLERGEVRRLCEGYYP